MIREYVRDVATSLTAVLIGMLVGALILQLAGYSPTLAYGSLLSSAFGDYYAALDTLTAMMPIIFTGAAAVVMFKSSLFFIGMEGSST